MNTLFFSDPHITLNSVEELEKTFQWIYDTAKKEDVSTIVMLGDYYDKKTPHIKAFLFGTEWASRFQKDFERVIFLRGNHDNTHDVSNLDYLKYLGVEVVDDCIIEGVYCGHFFAVESPISYGKKVNSVKTLLKKKSIKYVLLGHYHDFCEIEKNAYHIGSTRYVSYAETENKVIALLKKKSLKFIEIPTVIPAITVFSVKELKDLPKNVKVRIVFNDFEEYKKNINKLDKYKKKFVDFKVKIDFNQSEEIKLELQEQQDLQGFVQSWLNKQDKDVKSVLMEVFETHGLIQ